MTRPELERKERAAKRGRVMSIHKGQVGDPEVDFSPVRGASAISLTTQLSREAFSLAGLDQPESTRETISVRFVPRRG